MSPDKVMTILLIKVFYTSFGKKLIQIKIEDSHFMKNIILAGAIFFAGATAFAGYGECANRILSCTTIYQLFDKSTSDHAGFSIPFGKHPKFKHPVYKILKNRQRFPKTAGRCSGS